MRTAIATLLCAAALGAATPQPLRVPFIAQRKNGCGAASVAMLMQYWSAKPANDGEIYRRLYDPDRGAIQLSAMKAYVEQSGFRAFTLHGTWPDVTAQLAKGRPVIVALRKSRSAPIHFAIVAGASGARVWMNDPTRSGTSTVPATRLQKQWARAGNWMLLATPRTMTD